jgi:GT2 family glycosyltransferase
MKFGAVYCLYDDHEYLDISLEFIKNKLDKVLFLISDIPWNGNVVNNIETIQKVKKLCEQNNNFELIQGYWTNEIDQRNFGLTKFYNENIDYCFIIDSDEIYHEIHFENIKEFIKKNPHVTAFHIEWNTYWKKQYYVISPREYYKPVIAVKVDSFKFTKIRHGITSISRTGNFIFQTKELKYNGILIPSQIAICFHLSYARCDDYMKRKLETNSHATEFIKNWYDNVWKKWLPEDKNLHPVTPEQYDKAIKEDFLVFPKQLKSFIKRENLQKLTSIIILNWNSYDLLVRCLELVKKNTSKKYEIIIIDNGSKNLSKEFDILMNKYDIIKVIKNKENLGFAIGVNQGIKIAEKTSDICLLNVDAEPQKEWLDELYNTLIKNPLAGVVGPLGNEIENEYQKENMVEVDTQVFNVHFYCVLIFRELIEKIGLLDTRFGLGGYEDNDFCIRTKLAGYQIWISSKSLVRHKSHQVFKINGIDNVELELKNEQILKRKLIQTFYEYGSQIDLIKTLPQLAEKCGLIIKD